MRVTTADTKAVVVVGAYITPEPGGCQPPDELWSRTLLGQLSTCGIVAKAKTRQAYYRHGRAVRRTRAPPSEDGSQNVGSLLAQGARYAMLAQSLMLTRRASVRECRNTQTMGREPELGMRLAPSTRYWQILGETLLCILSQYAGERGPSDGGMRG